MTDKSEAKTMTIAFPGGGKVPAKVLGLETDKTCKPNEAVDVPTGYGKFWIGRGIAKEVKAETATTAAAATGKATKTAKES